MKQPLTAGGIASWTLQIERKTKLTRVMPDSVDLGNIRDTTALMKALNC